MGKAVQMYNKNFNYC